MINNYFAGLLFHFLMSFDFIEDAQSKCGRPEDGDQEPEENNKKERKGKQRT